MAEKGRGNSSAEAGPTKKDGLGRGPSSRGFCGGEGRADGALVGGGEEADGVAGWGDQAVFGGLDLPGEVGLAGAVDGFAGLELAAGLEEVVGDVAEVVV